MKFGRRRRQHGIAWFDDVAPAHVVGADAELPCQFVDRGFDRDLRLGQAVATKRARWHRVGVDGEAIDLLVRTVVDRDGLGQRVEHHGAGMIAVGAGVGEHLELERGEPAVGIGAGLDVDPHRMPRRGRDELLLAGQLQLDRSSGLERRERQNVLDEHLLLAAKAAADAFAEHADLVQGKPKDVRQRAAGQERHLRGGADIEHAGSIEPGEAAMGLQRRVLHAVAVEGRLIGDGRRGECRRHVAVFAMRSPPRGYAGDRRYDSRWCGQDE